jgi:hypothetical protein
MATSKRKRGFKLFGLSLTTILLIGGAFIYLNKDKEWVKKLPIIGGLLGKKEETATN